VGSCNGGLRADRAHRKCRIVRYDTVIVGAGFAGSTLGERLASQAGQRVLVIDRRPHMGGNAYDERDRAGILVHRYGPHIFHTNSEDVFAYLSRFTAWRPYEHRVLTSVDGKLLPMPINLDTVNRYFGLSLQSEEMDPFLATLRPPVATVRTSEDVVVSRVGRELYDKFFRGYTRKQWGLDPSQLDASVAARVPARSNRDDRYFTDRFQVMPRDGYTAMFERMLDHPGITLMLGIDFRELTPAIRYDDLVFTGPVDEYFDYCYGALPYRSLRFKHVTLPQQRLQDAPWSIIRTITRIRALPNTSTSPANATRTRASATNTRRRRAIHTIPSRVPKIHGSTRSTSCAAEAIPNVHFVGRLGTYKYYNMDQVVAQALTTYARMQGTSSWIPA